MNAAKHTFAVGPTAAPAIRVRVTVPRFSGTTKILVRTILGLDDLAELFARGRVGGVDSDPLHDSFDLDLEADTGVGGETNAGLIELMNDGGALRLTLPASWGSVLTRFADRTDTVVLNGKRVSRGWFRVRPGARVEVPVPGLTPARWIGVGIAG